MKLISFVAVAAVALSALAANATASLSSTAHESETELALDHCGNSRPGHPIPNPMPAPKPITPKKPKAA